MKIIIKLFIVLCLLSCVHKPSELSLVHSSLLESPDQKIQLEVFLSADQSLNYSIKREGKMVIDHSDLGLNTSAGNFTKDVKIEAVSNSQSVTDDYTMRVGKKHKIHYTANEKVFTLVNAQQQKLNVIFRVSNDGVAFRYAQTNPTHKEIHFLSESSSFQFSADTKAWLQPMSVAQTGWSNTNPSYEEHYQRDIPVGTVSTLGAGWAFPALFRTSENNWVLITETAVSANWHASRLHHESTNGKYKIDIPQSPEVFTGGGLLAKTNQDFISPWRIIALGPLSVLMESTLGTDLAEKAISVDQNIIKPGHSSWSWAILKDDFTTFDVQKKFIDYAAAMHWDYTLVDADWDKKIGYEKLKQLVDYAAQKNVGILVWYNSSGDWNKTPYSPKSELLTAEKRAAVFSRLKAIGVKGLKIDFFAGDGQSMIAYYHEILKDAAQYGFLINFHGATLPRGWQRTYPHLMTMESIKGFEFTTFTQGDQNAAPPHIATALFARNVFDPMDYTPMAFGDIPNIKRVTANSFELAESVLMLSGIQHFAEIPEGMEKVPEYVKNFLRELPREWDDIKFIEGFPGKYLVLARRAGDSWYVAGINAEKDNKTINLDLSFAGDKKGTLITSGSGERDFISQSINNKNVQINLGNNQGFVLLLK